ncbi:MAG: hypothetical protein FWD89_01275 [Firmicutes bacterium]|nr:hypothetical protein [Bacillota bacterium]
MHPRLFIFFRNVRTHCGEFVQRRKLAFYVGLISLILGIVLGVIVIAGYHAHFGADAVVGAFFGQFRHKVGFWQLFSSVFFKLLLLCGLFFCLSLNNYFRWVSYLLFLYIGYALGKIFVGMFILFGFVGGLVPLLFVFAFSILLSIYCLVAFCMLREFGCQIEKRGFGCCSHKQFWQTVLVLVVSLFCLAFFASVCCPSYIRGILV